MGGVSQALAKAASAPGATIRTSTEVRRIITARGRAIGVEVADGSRHDSRAILANVDVKTTSGRLVDPEAVDEAFLAKVRGIDATGVVTKLNCLLSELADFAFRPAKPARAPHWDHITI